MISYPDPDAVLADLGDKVVGALAGAVVGAQRDLAVYRSTLPELAASHGPRGLANWIHDQMWRHVVAALDEHPAVELVEAGATREVIVGDRFRIRVKRHGADGSTSSYATPTALDFMAQPQAQLPGLEVLNLTAGYEWDEDALEIVRAVLSLRDGPGKAVWLISLDDGDTGFGRVEHIWSPEAPNAPVVTIRRAGGAAEVEALQE